MLFKVKWFNQAVDAAGDIINEKKEEVKEFQITGETLMWYEKLNSSSLIEDLSDPNKNSNIKLTIDIAIAAYRENGDIDDLTVQHIKKADWLLPLCRNTEFQSMLLSYFSDNPYIDLTESSDDDTKKKR